jgi:hypothetical protein
MTDDQAILSCEVNDRIANLGLMCGGLYEEVLKLNVLNSGLSIGASEI